MNVRFRRASWLTILIAFNAGFLAINALAACKIYWYQPPTPSLLDALMRRPSEPQVVEYKDFISIMLTGLSAMITVLGIGLATIAIWGYARLSEDAKTAAEQAGAQAARDVANAVATRTTEEFLARGGSVSPNDQRLFEALTRDRDDSGRA